MADFLNIYMTKGCPKSSWTSFHGRIAQKIGKKHLKIDLFLRFFSVSPKVDVIFHPWPISFIGDIKHFFHDFLTVFSILVRDKTKKNCIDFHDFQIFSGKKSLKNRPFFALFFSFTEGGCDFSSVTNSFYRRHMPFCSWIFDWFVDFSP